MTTSNPLPQYKRAPLGSRALRRLGVRLAESDQLSAEDELLYRDFITDAQRRRLAVQEILDHLLAAISEPMPRLGVQSTGRVKTLKTLREKLQRDAMTKLPSVRDVAGVRVVVDCSLVELELGVDIIRKLMSESGPLSRLGFTGEARLINRLEEPMHGYRALHLEVRLDGLPAEIQFRTSLQHEWAEFMELLCDRWGREPRYGLPVVEPDKVIRQAKQMMVDRTIELSGAIAGLEEGTRAVGLGHINFDSIASDTYSFPAGVRERYEHIRAATAPGLERLQGSVRDLIDTLQTIFHLLESLTANEETP